jgi:hypothetical protein
VASVGLVARFVWAEPPAPPPLSTVLPADDLVALVDEFLEEFNKNVADEKTFAEQSANVKRDAHTLAAVALVLANHDSPHRLSKSAPALVGAAQKLAAANDLAAVKAALAEVQAVSSGAPSAAEAEWIVVAPMGELMKQVTASDARLKRGLRRLDRDPEATARHAALLGAIAQVVTVDTHEVKNPDDVGRWYELCAQMRDTAGEVNAAVKKGDKEGAEAAYARLTKSCEACHEVFRPEIK